MAVNIFGSPTRRWVAALAVVLGLAALWVTDAIGRDKILRVDADLLLGDAALAPRALAIGRGVFARRCAECHGEGGQGDRDRGVPDLRDADRLYGEGRVSEIELIVLHGIRAGDSRGWNLTSMPAYATREPLKGSGIPPLRPDALRDVAAHVRRLSGQSIDAAAAVRGAAVYRDQGCADCHGEDAVGDTSIGAPNLADRSWQYGDGSQASVERLIGRGLHGVCPAFQNRLDPVSMRAVAAYTASLAPAGARR